MCWLCASQGKRLRWQRVLTVKIGIAIYALKILEYVKNAMRSLLYRRVMDVRNAKTTAFNARIPQKNALSVKLAT